MHFSTLTSSGILPALFLCSIAVVNAQTPLEWTLGMNVTVFVTQQGSCPSNFAAAQADSSYSLVYASSTTINAGSPVPTNAISTFYITNGFHEISTGFDSNAYTNIRAAEPLDTGGGCWSLTSDNTFTINDCDMSGPQTFYMDTTAAPKTSRMIFSYQLAVVNGPSTPNGPLINADTGSSLFCLYDAVSGTLVTNPTVQEEFHFVEQQITNLTGATIPGPNSPSTDSSLQGCGIGNELNLISADCILAKTLNSMPAGCNSDPDTRECILHLFPAFCIDLYAVRMGLNAEAELEYCLRRIALGPCVANPSGAACSSGLFPGIAFVGVSGGQSSGVVDATSDTGPLFGPGSPDIPLEDSFWIGALKNVLNGGIGIINGFMNIQTMKEQTECIGKAKYPGHYTDQISKAIIDGCKEAYKYKQVITPFGFDDNVEEAGNMFANVVSWILPAADLYELAQATGLIELAMSKFVPKSAVGILSEGSYLEAVGPSGDTVRIFKDGGGGTPTAMFSKDELEGMRESTTEESFNNCVYCKSNPPRRMARNVHQRRGGGLKNLCCVYIPKVIEDWRAAPLENQVLGSMNTAGDLNPGQASMLTKMQRDFKLFFVNKISPVLATDRITGAFYNALESGLSQSVIDKSQLLYGLADNEMRAVREWMDSYNIDTANLQSAIGQMNPARGHCFRTTFLGAEDVAMLENYGPGLRSHGPPGHYTIEDLVDNLPGPGTSTTEAHPRQVMASTLGYKYLFSGAGPYRYIINSRSGRFISPLGGHFRPPEVVFVKGFSGIFKLLGHQDINGGLAAQAARKPGPFKVFFFDEIDVPSQIVGPRICGPGVTQNCRAAQLTPPTFGN